MDTTLPRHARRRFAGTTAWGVLAATALATGAALAVPTAASAAPAGAVSTSTNVAAGTGACLHGNTQGGTADVVNCNHYAAKTDVWLSGLPTEVEDGEYFFAVLEPGGQNADPNDAFVFGDRNLSDDFDGRAKRSFTISGGAITATGGHILDGGRLQLAPFSTTTNNGGGYILAVCALPDNGGSVTASACKYDYFKVDEGAPEQPDTEALPLEVMKDADGSTTTSWTWAAQKSATSATTVRKVGGTATFGYRVDVSHDGPAPSEVEVHGTITVSNPNSAQVTDVDVTDQLSDGTVCTVATEQGGAATGVTVDPGDNYFPYTCQLDTASDLLVDNTATASWAGQDVGDRVLLKGQRSFTFEDVPFVKHRIDECVEVTDTFGVAGGTPEAPTSLGTVCAGGPAPAGATYDGATRTFTFGYSRTVPVPAHGCVSYDNTAAFTTTDDADDTTQSGSSGPVTVTVCGPLDTGAHTMGFWQNKNGQALIKNAGSSGGVCTVTPALRTYAPFQDLSATASCSAAATYTTNVVKAASASGASMNKMLKGQMLATTLSVHFSGRTGSPIPAGLGGTTVDLTAICGSVSSCPPFQNAGPAFGGATSMTIAGMLAHASSTSNVGGTSWYGQVKTTQGLAKNAFDAINNNVVFAPLP